MFSLFGFFFKLFFDFFVVFCFNDVGIEYFFINVGSHLHGDSIKGTQARKFEEVQIFVILNLRNINLSLWFFLFLSLLLSFTTLLRLFSE